MNYKSGDLVTITGNCNGHRFKIGETVRLKYRAESSWAAEHLDGHDWWNVRESDMKPFKPAIMPQKIVITTDGKTTLARLFDGKKMVKRAEAKCAPSDTFNFNTGANLAFNRLVYGTDYNPQDVKIKPKTALAESKPEPVKLYCVKDFNGWLTKGKVYDFSGGVNYDHDDYTNRYGNYDIWKRSNPSFAACLVPLVRRPAKVGEWVLPEDKWFSDRKISEKCIYKVENIWTDDPRGIIWFDNDNRCAIRGEYFVLDGYHGDPA